jgi:hypothetical protein
LLLCVAASLDAQVLPIAEITEIDQYGFPTKLGQAVTVTGVVTVASGIFNEESGDLDVYIQDGTGGVNLFTRGLKGIRLSLGDSVIVTGKVNQGGSSPIEGITRLKIEKAVNISVVASGTVPRPVVVTAADLAQASEPPLEPYEGLLVMIADATIESGQWPTEPGVGATITIGDPSGATLPLRIDGDTDIGGTDRPDEPFLVVGVVVQNSSFPYLAGYTLWPRSRYGDFLKMGSGSGLATIEPATIGDDVTAFDLNVTVAGNGWDTLSSFSIDLPVAAGWVWEGRESDVELSGPGLAGAAYVVTASGVVVSGAGILDAQTAFGVVTLKNIGPPAVIVPAEVTVRTSVDDVNFGDIARQPMLYPEPAFRINEVYPDDGTSSSSNAFIEILNTGTSDASLDGFALCELDAVGYCKIELRHIFGAGDPIPPGGYVVVAEAATGFSERFGFAPDIEADISPLGRIGGDGALCGPGKAYEVISLWRDAALSDLVDYSEYGDMVECGDDVCVEFGDSADAFPYLPPVGYALLAGDFDPCCPYQVLSASPTPGAENVITYAEPVILKVDSYGLDAVEVVFGEPMDKATLTATGHFAIGEKNPSKIYASLSGEKCLLYFEGLTARSAALAVTGVAGLTGEVIGDTLCDFTVIGTGCIAMCEVQRYDEDGYSPHVEEVLCATGFVTVPPGIFLPDYSSMYVQGLDGCGINVFSTVWPSPVPRLGDFVQVRGQVVEYLSGSGAGITTEIDMGSAPNVKILSRKYPEPPALVLGTGDVGREENEGKLIETEGAVISASEYSFYVDDGSGGVQIYQNYTPIDFTRFKVGMYAKVKGVVLQYDYTRPFLEGYELVPRYDSDIEIKEDAFPAEAVLEVAARVFCPSCGDEGFIIKFGGQAFSQAVLRLFDAGGREVRTLYSGASAGISEHAWDGRDSAGKIVPPGLYVCYLEIVEARTGEQSTRSVPIVVGIRLE